MNEEERELDLALAECEQENRLLRARNERLMIEVQLLSEALRAKAWVELTEDDICKNLLADGYNTEAEFMRAVHLIEAAEKILKEKNGG